MLNRSPVIWVHMLTFTLLVNIILVYYLSQFENVLIASLNIITKDLQHQHCLAGDGTIRCGSILHVVGLDNCTSVSGSSSGIGHCYIRTRKHN